MDYRGNLVWGKGKNAHEPATILEIKGRSLHLDREKAKRRTGFLSRAKGGRGTYGRCRRISLTTIEDATEHHQISEEKRTWLTTG